MHEFPSGFGSPWTIRLVSGDVRSAVAKTWGESMLVHIHTMRNWCATALVLVPAPLLLGWASTPESKDLRLVQVSGRVTCNDRPFRGTIHFLPEAKGVAHAMGPVKPGGSFPFANHNASKER
jgi:hypothetical protein